MKGIRRALRPARPDPTGSLGLVSAQGHESADLRRHPKESGRASPYSAAAHSWLLPSSGAVCSAIIPGCRAVRSCLLHLPICSTESSTAMLPSPVSSGATQSVHSAAVCRSFRTQSICFPLRTSRRVCREQISSSMNAHDRHSLGRDCCACRSLHRNWPASLCSLPPSWVPAQHMPSILTPL